MLIYSIAVFFLALQNSSGLKIYRSNVTECGNQGTMVYTVRRTFLEELDERRASLAEGESPAANMLFMAYDCNLEKEAIQLTARCDGFPDKTQFKGNRMSVATFGYQGNGVITVARKAVSDWWSKKPLNWDNSQKITADYSAMPFFLVAQAEADKVGCSVKVCDNFSSYIVACVYGEEAKVGHNLYEEGTACTNCAGHCYQKLCNATTSV